MAQSDKAAAYLQVNAKTLRMAAERGDINGIHPLPDGPWLFDRADLDALETKSVVQRARQDASDPTGSMLKQQNLFPSIT